jgi:hypothetical protein
METGKASVRKAEKYEDKSIFRYGLTYVQHHDTINEFIKKQESHKNIICFPSKDFETLLVLETGQGATSHFLLYDIFNERIKRKIMIKSSSGAAFAVDPE